MSERNEDSQNKKDSNISIWVCAIGSVLFILALVIAYFVYLQSNFPLFSRSDYATLGDSFGILSSLFSGLAFAGLIVTIVMQNKTLKLQMKELREAKKESARQSKAQEGQEKVMNSQFQAIQLQQFETTFFKLIDRHEKTIRDRMLKVYPSHMIENTYDYLNGYEFINKKYKNGIGLDVLDNNFYFHNKNFIKSYYNGFMNYFNFLDSEKELLIKVKRLDFYVSYLKNGMTDCEVFFIFHVFYLNNKNLGSIDSFNNKVLFNEGLAFDLFSIKDLQLDKRLELSFDVLEFIDFYGISSLKEMEQTITWVDCLDGECEGFLSGKTVDNLESSLFEVVERENELNKYAEIFDVNEWKEAKKISNKLEEYSDIDFETFPDCIKQCSIIFVAIERERKKLQNLITKLEENRHWFVNCAKFTGKIIDSYKCH